MCVSESVSRSVRVRGSCADWLPLVRDCLADRGFCGIAVDAASGSVTADSGVPGRYMCPAVPGFVLRGHRRAGVRYSQSGG